MSEHTLASRHAAFSRPYELAAELRMRLLGYDSGRGLRSTLGTIKRLVEYQFLPHYFGGPPLWRMMLRRFNARRTSPDFCIVGPIKSGTSDLSVNMFLHPNVLAPIAKEFLSADPKRWPMYYPTERQKRRQQQRVGVALAPLISPYLHWMEFAHNLARQRPGMKVVVTLRDPAERLYSHWKWEVLLSGRPRAAQLPFLSSFAAYVDSAMSVFPELPMYTACGFQPLNSSIYWKAVRQWREFFGANNVLVLDIGEYFENPGAFLQRVQLFVGLPPAEPLRHGQNINENPLKLPPPDLESMSSLREFFQPYNEKLWTLIGEEFDW